MVVEVALEGKVVMGFALVERVVVVERRVEVGVRRFEGPVAMAVMLVVVAVGQQAVAVVGVEGLL